KSGQTLVTPSAALATPTAVADPAPAAPRLDMPAEPSRPAPEPAATEGAAKAAPGNVTGTPVESLQRSTDKTDSPRRDKTGKDVRPAPKPDRQQNKPPSPPKPKGIDFGI